MPVGSKADPRLYFHPAFIPRLSSFHLFPTGCNILKNLLSVPMRCTAFHFLAPLMRRQEFDSPLALHSGLLGRVTDTQRPKTDPEAL